MDKVRVGLVGLGGMGNGHYLAYKNITDMELVSICDIRINELKNKITDSKVHLYDDLTKMLDNEKLDVIDIVTPSYLHADMVIECLNRGLNVLCEKPMTLTVEDCDRIKNTLKKTNKKFMTAHVVRFMDPYVFLKKEIEEKKLGKVLKGEFKRISSIPTWSYQDWMRNEKLSGGVGLDLSIHDIDFVQSVFGMPLKTNSIYRHLNNNSTYIISSLIYEDALITCEGTWYNADIPFMAEFLVVFENGYIMCRDGKLIKNNQEIDLTKQNKTSDIGINISCDNAYEKEIRYFIDCVKNNKDVDFITVDSSSTSVELTRKLINEAIIID